MMIAEARANKDMEDDHRENSQWRKGVEGRIIRLK